MSWLPDGWRVEIGPATSDVIRESARAMGKCACSIEVCRPLRTGRLIVHREDVVVTSGAFEGALMRGAWRAWCEAEWPPIELPDDEPTPSDEDIAAMVAAFEREGD